MHLRLQFLNGPGAAPVGHVEELEQRRRPGDHVLSQVPCPKAAAAVVECKVDAGAPRALLRDAPFSSPHVERIEAAGRKHEGDRREEQAQGHDGGAAPCHEMKPDRRRKSHLRAGRRQLSHSREPIALRAGRNPGHVAGREMRLRVAVEKVEERSPVLVGRVGGDLPPAPVDQQSAGKVIVGIGRQHAQEGLGGGSVRSGFQRGVQPLGKQRRPHIHFAGRCTNRKASLEAQVVDRDRDHAQNGKGKHDRGGARRPAPVDERPKDVDDQNVRASPESAQAAQALRRAFPSLPRDDARTRRRHCRVFTRHRRPQKRFKLEIRNRRSARISTIRILVRIFVQPLDETLRQNSAIRSTDSGRLFAKLIANNRPDCRRPYARLRVTMSRTSGESV